MAYKKIKSAITLLLIAQLLVAQSFELIDSTINAEIFKKNIAGGVGLTTKEGVAINGASVGSFFWGGAFNTAYMVDRKRQLITLFYFQRAPFVLPALLSKLEKIAISIIDTQ